MIRSEVGVTDFAPLAPDRVVLTTSFETLLTERDAFRFFVITRPFRISELGVDTSHIKPIQHIPMSPLHQSIRKR